MRMEYHLKLKVPLPNNFFFKLTLNSNKKFSIFRVKSKDIERFYVMLQLMLFLRNSSVSSQWEDFFIIISRFRGRSAAPCDPKIELNQN